MKKYFLSMLAIAGLTLTSCQKGEEPTASLKFSSELTTSVKSGVFGGSSRDPRGGSGDALYNGELTLTITNDSDSSVVTTNISLDGDSDAINSAFAGATVTGLAFGNYTVAASYNGTATSASSRLALGDFTTSIVIDEDGDTVTVNLSPADAFIASDSSGVDAGAGNSFSQTLDGGAEASDFGYYVAPGTYTVAGRIADGSDAELASSSVDVTLAAGEYSTVIFSYTPGDATIGATISGWTGIDL